MIVSFIQGDKCAQKHGTGRRLVLSVLDWARINGACRIFRPDIFFEAAVNNSGKFMSIMSGESLRHFLSSHGAVREIVHFGTHQAFKNRSTYTCILILGKPAYPSYEIAFVQDWNRFLFDHRADYSTYAADSLSASPWTFIPGQITDRLTAINEQCCSLSDLARIFVGVQTSNDKIYMICPSKPKYIIEYEPFDRRNKHIFDKIGTLWILENLFLLYYRPLSASIMPDLG